MVNAAGAADLSAHEAQRIGLVRDALKQALLPLEIVLNGVDAPFSVIEPRTDPFDGSVTLYCLWQDRHGQLLGSLQLHDSGRVFAEYDVVKNHPLKSGWFIESVSVWGDDSQLRHELQLLKLPG